MIKKLFSKISTMIQRKQALDVNFETIKSEGEVSDQQVIHHKCHGGNTCLARFSL